DRDLLWASDISTSIYGIAPDGEVRVELDNELRIYGLAYYPEDADGYNLYIFCRGPDNVGISVYRMNPDNGEYLEAAYLDVGDGRPGGFQITNRWDPYAWSVVGIVQNDDRLAIWHLDSRTDWLLVDPTEGVIEAEDHTDLTVTFNSGGFFEDELTAELVFTHDGVGGETTVDVSLEVTSGGMAQRTIDLPIGWSLVSVNVQPERDDIRNLVQPLVDDELLILIKDARGNFYSPRYDYCDIDYWEGLDSYQILLSGSGSLQIEGEVILWDTAIPLEEGWNGVSYLPRHGVDATVALSGLGDALLIAKDGDGNFYLPEWDDFSNMGSMSEGNGYFIKATEDIELTYNLGDERFMGSDDIGIKTSRTSIPPIGVEGKPACQSDQTLQPGECSYSLLLLTEGIESGTRLEAFTPSGELAGRGIVDKDGRCGMALWGKSSLNPPFEKGGNNSGFNDGEAITITSAGSADILVGELEWLDGDISGWKADGWGVARITQTAEIPLKFGIVSAYPNPFNSQMRVSYNLLETGIVDLAVYDVSGRRVTELTSGRQVSGVHTVMFDGKDMPSGVYMMRLKSGSQSSFMKVILMK
ncbi:T9SS type A sorting domain-containing protein, partial [bacterium]|nr:T9SS type A sorting domain-containing protein [bacterium]